MKTNINFKSGFLTGTIIGIILLGFAYFSLQQIKQKADDIANINLHELAYQDLDGNEIQLSDFKGKHVLINCWATWCGPCVKEFPLLDDTYNELKEDFIFLMISDESRSKIRNFAETNPYQFVYLKTGSLLKEGITTVPQSFLLDKTGKMIHHHPTIFEGDVATLIATFNSWVNN